MKRFTALLLALLLAMPTVLTACAESTENADPAKEIQNTDVQNPGAETESDETERLYADIPADSNFDGYEFTVLSGSNSEYFIVQNDFAAEEITGEAINDAKYNRNIAVGDKLNVKIISMEAPLSGQSMDSSGDMIIKDVQGGVGAYDIAAISGYVAASLCISNYLYDISTVPYIDLTAPWWDQKANDSLKILDQLFYTTGDITTSDNDATYCIMFNKQIVTDYNLENPYELVNEGKWTMDAFIGMANQVTSDVDGNGVYDKNDLYGALVWDDTMMGIVNCTGETCVTTNAEGLMELTLNTERILNAVTKFLEFGMTNVSYEYQRSNWNDSLLINMFSANQSLFLTQLFQLIPKLREMDNDFGILPYFKYEEAQSDYYTTMGSWHSVFLTVPAIQHNLERTGIVAECLANEGMYGLTEAYYEKTLKGKSARDQESQAMLDLIFANRIYDLGWYHQIGGYNEAVMNLLRNYNNNMASMLKGGEKATKKILERNNQKFIDAKEERLAQLGNN